MPPNTAPLQAATVPEIKIDGQARAEFLPVMFGPELMQAFREFKAAWDPAGRMNPGKLIDARRVDQDLRWREDERPITVQSKLAFRSEIGNGFGRELERCVGMGRCRAERGGTMCPSYRATREDEGIAVELTLTTRACPLGEMIVDDVRERLARRFQDASVSVGLVWSPLWTPDRITDRGLELLGRAPRGAA